jgi:hypothetical protein
MTGGDCGGGLEAERPGDAGGPEGAPKVGRGPGSLRLGRSRALVARAGESARVGGGPTPQGWEPQTGPRRSQAPVVPSVGRSACVRGGLADRGSATSVAKSWKATLPDSLTSWPPGPAGIGLEECGARLVEVEGAGVGRLHVQVHLLDLTATARMPQVWLCARRSVARGRRGNGRRHAPKALHGQVWRLWPVKGRIPAWLRKRSLVSSSAQASCLADW